MQNSSATPLQRFKGASNQLFSSLREYLNRYIAGNSVFFDELSQKIKVVRGRRREAHFDLLESKINEEFPET